MLALSIESVSLRLMFAIPNHAQANSTVQTGKLDRSKTNAIGKGTRSLIISGRFTMHFLHSALDSSLRSYLSPVERPMNARKRKDRKSQFGCTAVPYSNVPQAGLRRRSSWTVSPEKYACDRQNQSSPPEASLDQSLRSQARPFRATSRERRPDLWLRQVTTGELVYVLGTSCLAFRGFRQ
jgi:hypothetical protein